MHLMMPKPFSPLHQLSWTFSPPVLSLTSPTRDRSFRGVESVYNEHPNFGFRDWSPNGGEARLPQAQLQRCRTFRHRRSSAPARQPAHSSHSSQCTLASTHHVARVAHRLSQASMGFGPGQASRPSSSIVMASTDFRGRHYSLGGLDTS